ncbi:hypothetical protein [Komagataeibacter diospyri]|uniref:DUF3311 domain-containing protein n=1 Tax=Komagataeibacter diospyri TaxID=1932662 RepID=A0A4V0WMF3_9PROT|nr:hypothetical protein [Komagataeibacter diospyri]GCE83472.1 hypothetical protein MSKU9_1613 [Komagataeibacter diospyri]GCE90222.1 hypothetical protein MSKU15_1823 [Komagataeibacter diospyri]
MNPDRQPDRPDWRRVALGLGVPFMAIVPVAPFLGFLSWTIMGIPVILVWMFVWFPLTSLCLWLCEQRS